MASIFDLPLEDEIQSDINKTSEWASGLRQPKRAEPPEDFKAAVDEFTRADQYQGEVLNLEEPPPAAAIPTPSAEEATPKSISIFDLPEPSAAAVPEEPTPEQVSLATQLFGEGTPTNWIKNKLKNWSARGWDLGAGLSDLSSSFIENIQIKQDDGSWEPLVKFDTDVAGFMREQAEGVRAGPSVDYQTEVKQEFLEGNYGTAAVKGILLGFDLFADSIPEMGAIMGGPATLVPYVGARTGEIAHERAVNDGREKAEGRDFGVALPAAVGVTLMDRVGLELMLPPAARKQANELVKKMAGERVTQALATTTAEGARKAGFGATARATGAGAVRGGTGETFTETTQELGEYLATHVGTEKGFQIAEAIDVSIQGALGGAAPGTTIGGVSGAAVHLGKPVDIVPPVVTPGVDPAPGPEAGIEEEAAQPGLPQEDLAVADADEARAIMQSAHAAGDDAQLRAAYEQLAGIVGDEAAFDYAQTLGVPTAETEQTTEGVGEAEAAAVAGAIPTAEAAPAAEAIPTAEQPTIEPTVGAAPAPVAAPAPEPVVEPTPAAPAVAAATEAPKAGVAQFGETPTETVTGNPNTPRLDNLKSEFQKYTDEMVPQGRAGPTAGRQRGSGKAVTGPALNTLARISTDEGRRLEQEGYDTTPLRHALAKALNFKNVEETTWQDIDTKLTRYPDYFNNSDRKAKQLTDGLTDVREAIRAMEAQGPAEVVDAAPDLDDVALGVVREQEQEVVEAMAQEAPDKLVETGAVVDEEAAKKRRGGEDYEAGEVKTYTPEELAAFQAQEPKTAPPVAPSAATAQPAPAPAAGPTNEFVSPGVAKAAKDAGLDEAAIASALNMDPGTLITREDVEQVVEKKSGKKGKLKAKATAKAEDKKAAKKKAPKQSPLEQAKAQRALLAEQGADAETLAMFDEQIAELEAEAAPEVEVEAEVEVETPTETKAEQVKKTAEARKEKKAKREAKPKDDFASPAARERAATIGASAAEIRARIKKPTGKLKVADVTSYENALRLDNESALFVAANKGREAVLEEIERQETARARKEGTTPLGGMGEHVATTPDTVMAEGVESAGEPLADGEYLNLQIITTNAEAARATGARQADIFDGDPVAVVSPANTAGVMNGGIDKVYMDRFGAQIERRVQAEIRRRYGDNAEMPIGDAFVIRTAPEGVQIPPGMPEWLIIAPTVTKVSGMPDNTPGGLAAMAAADAARKAGIRGQINMPTMGMGLNMGDPAKAGAFGRDLIRAVDMIDELETGNVATVEELQTQYRRESAPPTRRAVSLAVQRASTALRRAKRRDEVNSTPETRQAIAEARTALAAARAEAPQPVWGDRPATFGDAVVRLADTPRNLPGFDQAALSIENRTEEQMRADAEIIARQMLAEAKENGVPDPVLYFHGRSKKNAENAMREPRPHRSGKFFVTESAGAALDYAKQRYGADNMGLVIWVMPGDVQKKLVAEGKITSSTMTQGSISQYVEGNEQAFREVVLDRDALEMLNKTWEDRRALRSDPLSGDPVLDSRDAAWNDTVRELLDGTDAPIGEVLQSMRDKMDSNDPLAAVIDQLIESGVADTTVRLVTPRQMYVISDGVAGTPGLYTRAPMTDGSQKPFIALDATQALDPEMARVFVHEAIHAATAEGMRTDNELAQRMNTLRQQVIQTLQDEGRADELQQYGLTDVDEFVAEAFTNPDFQETLASITSPDGKSFWSKLVEAVRDFLGMPIDSNSVLAEVMAAAPDLFMDSAQSQRIIDQGRAVAPYIQKMPGQKFDRNKPMEPQYIGEMKSVEQEMQEIGIDFSAAERIKRDAGVKRDARTVRAAQKVGRNVAAGTASGATMGNGAPGGKLQNLIARAASDAHKSRRPLLGMMSLDTIERVYNSIFNGLGRNGTNPLVRYVRAKQAAQATARKIQRDADQKVQKVWQALRAKMPQADYEAFSVFVHQASMADVEPTASWTDPANAVARTASNKKQRLEAHRRLRNEYQKLKAKHPEVAKAYKVMRNFYKDLHVESRNTMIDNLMQIYDLGGRTALANQLKAAKTAEDVAKVKAPKVFRKDANGKQVLVDMPSWPKIQKALGEFIEATGGNGPYFPLMRDGEYTVEYSRKTTKTYSTKKAAEAAKKQLFAEDPSVKTSGVTKDANGNYTFVLTERGFDLYRDRQSADKANAQYVAAGWETGGVTLKEDMQVADNTAAAQMLEVAERRLKKQGKAGELALNQLRNALITQLPETAMQKRMLKRKNITGAEKSDPLTNFSKFIQGASWQMGNLQQSRNLAESYVDIQRAAKESGRGATPLSGDNLIKLGQVASELAKRQSLDAAEPGGIARAAGQYGFINYLMSMSYSIVNSTQTLVLSLPHLVGEVGSGRATAAMTKAYQDILPTLTRELIKRGGGYRGLLNKSFYTDAQGNVQDATDLTHVVDNVLAVLRSKGQNDAANAIEKLTEAGIIDTTFSLDVSEEAQSEGRSKAGRFFDHVTRVGRTMPYITEILNRTVTATAAYNAFRAEGLTDAQAIEKTRETILRTHFDYSMLNRPRYFKTGDLARVATMYKMHPLGLYTYMLESVSTMMGRDGATKAEKVKAGKQLGAMVMTHGVFAGAAGAILMEPVKAVLGLIGMFFDWDDEDYDDFFNRTDYWLHRTLYDMMEKPLGKGAAGAVSNAITYGLPEAAGFSMHNRLGMQSLFLQWSEGESTLGSVGQTVANSISGPMLGAAQGFGTAASYWANGGDFWKGAEYLAPKGVRDTLRAFRYLDVGMTDFNGKTIRDAEDFGPVDFAAKVVGFQSTTEAQTQRSRRYGQSVTQGINKKRQSLLNEIGQAKTVADRLKLMEKVRKYNRELPSDLRGYTLDADQIMSSLERRSEAEAQTKFGRPWNERDAALMGRLRMYEE